MKHIKSLLAIATVALLGSSAWAESVNVQLLGTATKTVTSSTKVTKDYYYKFVLGSGASTYVSSTKTDATQNGSKSAYVTADFTGRAFTPGSATITLQQASNEKFSKNTSTLDTFTVYVAEAYALPVIVGESATLSGHKGITTGSSNWSYSYVSGSDCIESVTITADTAETKKQPIITIKGKAEGTAVINFF